MHLRLSPGAQSRRISWMPVMVVMASLIQSGVNTASHETEMPPFSCSSSSTRKVIMKRSCRTLVRTTTTWVRRNRRMRPGGPPPSGGEGAVAGRSLMTELDVKCGLLRQRAGFCEQTSVLVGM